VSLPKIQFDFLKLLTYFTFAVAAKTTKAIFVDEECQSLVLLPIFQAE
jgi:hypothetical protein